VFLLQQLADPFWPTTATQWVMIVGATLTVMGAIITVAVTWAHSRRDIADIRADMVRGSQELLGDLNGFGTRLGIVERETVPAVNREIGAIQTRAFGLERDMREVREHRDQLERQMTNILSEIRSLNQSLHTADLHSATKMGEVIGRLGKIEERVDLIRRPHPSGSSNT
jgi:hypothetical protein